jgi:hypothetical protein
MDDTDLKVGDRVEIGGVVLRGRRRTIVRRSRMLSRKVWLVELDGGNWAMRRTRVDGRVLRRIDGE